MARTPDTSSGATTPRFTSQTATAEDLLKTQTVGLVHLSEFRKRRADALEQSSGAATPSGDETDGALTPGSEAPLKRKRKKATKGLLSFGDDAEEETVPRMSRRDKSSVGLAEQPEGSTIDPVSRKLTPNPNSSLPVPKAMTKAALAAEAVQREKLRREFLEVQEQVMNSEILIPFVFYDGSNIPGGVVKVKKGDHIWLILDRGRKVGAEQGVSSSTGTSLQSKDESKKKWARIGVDDLMLVRGEVIVPPHYEIYYFIANRVPDPLNEGRLLFNYKGTARPKATTEEPLLRIPGKDILEGRDDDPTYTKVVDRRWYERNKHIYPASMWKEFKVGKDFEQSLKSRKDAEGNAFFFS